MRSLRFALPFLFLATVPSGFALGGAWSFLTVLLTPLAIAGLDGVLGSDAASPAPIQAWGYRMLPRLYIFLQLAVTAWAGWRVADPALSLVEAAGLTLSTGITAGVFGMVAAHEMVHSPSAAERSLGLAFLASVGDMQFRIAHIHGHHLRAATRLDPASARLGETVYGFAVRSVTGQAREAWSFEAERLRRGGRSVIGPANRLLQYLVVEAALVAAVAAALGPRGLIFLLAQALIAVFLLEAFNYIAHYGLERRLLADGRPEPLTERHSWNSIRRMNNWSLFNMGRHSDHHRAPMRSFQDLEAVADAPELPSGYAGAILMALAPPLWRRTMDHRARAWSEAGRT